MSFILYKRSGRQILLTQGPLLGSGLAYHGIDFWAEIPYTVHKYMKRPKIAAEELAVLVENFSRSIKAAVSKSGLERRGIDPEDIIQEVRIKVWKRFGHEKDISFSPLYIQRVINSTLIDSIRTVRRQERLIRQAKQTLMFEQRDIIEDPPQENIFREWVGQAVESLLESRRKVVKLFLMDLTLAEMSSSLNWSRDKTRNLLYRGLSDLKEKLRDRGIEYEDRY
jgi:RNA polymerase sigma-70 factor (ECF subfamily)